MGENGGRNLYAFILNNPNDSLDLFGLISAEFAWIFIKHYFTGDGIYLGVIDNDGEIKNSPEYQDYIELLKAKNKKEYQEIIREMVVGERRTAKVVLLDSNLELSDFWSLLTIHGSEGPLEFDGDLKIYKDQPCTAEMHFEGSVIWRDHSNMHPDIALDALFRLLQKFGKGVEYPYSIHWDDEFTFIGFSF